MRTILFGIGICFCFQLLASERVLSREFLGYQVLGASEVVAVAFEDTPFSKTRVTKWQLFGVEGKKVEFFGVSGVKDGIHFVVCREIIAERTLNSWTHAIVSQKAYRILPLVADELFRWTLLKKDGTPKDIEIRQGCQIMALAERSEVNISQALLDFVDHNSYLKLADLIYTAWSAAPDNMGIKVTLLPPRINGRSLSQWLNNPGDIPLSKAKNSPYLYHSFAQALTVYQALSSQTDTDLVDEYFPATGPVTYAEFAEFLGYGALLEDETADFLPITLKSAPFELDWLPIGRQSNEYGVRPQTADENSLNLDSPEEITSPIKYFYVDPALAYTELPDVPKDIQQVFCDFVGKINASNAVSFVAKADPPFFVCLEKP